MGKWLKHFLQETCQEGTDITDTTRQKEALSVMSVHSLYTFDQNNTIFTDVSVMSVSELGMFDKNVDNDKNQQAIDLSPYIDYYNERAAIREFDGKQTRSEAEHYACLETLQEFMKCEYFYFINEFEYVLRSKNVII
jgi:hypothetical protein